ncbi:MAG: phospho-N-acetylmuramoyl-pentapeptide-transferase [Acidobacteria bacterium RIFCSPHIGHO2_12_FULL_67_30]|nr:MAG: phospho-N-acetylmuramoyl-pentapeptide-transferase [Acidobacteria bacterium RIFCSPHIGHO2_01_FULL_67_28]OFV84762.1 MAG: phospho-N-acetylmuramoyl-pentapeptide-transferase [Acidobacteria bacterium RIFCSPHIGHO2_02_FULL_67_57]OFV87849.1 MAG: phospho-N-acetylmuramoyl-pentapeptide-transferase [Acidobacteria bacterium RIFCSPHIGHO2_12_FULL_67_30]
MLYHLLYEWLQPHFSPLNVFRYITVRTAFAGLTALLLMLVLGPWMIRRLRAFQVGQFVREEVPGHQPKAGTPTMGGLLILPAVMVSALLWTNLTNPFLWLALFALVAYGAIGFADDYLKTIHRRSLGLRAKTKFSLQVLTAVVIAGVLLSLRGAFYSTDILFPFFKKLRPDLVIDSLLNGWYTLPLAALPFVVFIVLVLVGSSNAVNLTDGLDGLAIGCVAIAAGALTALTYISGHAKFAEYLDLSKMPQVGELTVFCAAMTGAALGFLWYNAHPAEVFMGDVGSLALGGAIGTVAIIIKQEILLFFIGGVFVLEALSVILQVGSFQLTGRRVFRMAPLHHHFELIGWKESKIIIRFWIAALIFALFALSTLKLR